MLLKEFTPNLIDYINLFKVLDNYMRRCKWQKNISSSCYVVSVWFINSDYG